METDVWMVGTEIAKKETVCAKLALSASKDKFLFSTPITP
jgi:hypothetical protein